MADNDNTLPKDSDVKEVEITTVWDDTAPMQLRMSRGNRVVGIKFGDTEYCVAPEEARSIWKEVKEFFEMDEPVVTRKTGPTLKAVEEMSKHLSQMTPEEIQARLHKLLNS
jgi:hypothetical protein